MIHTSAFTVYPQMTGGDDSVRRARDVVQRFKPEVFTPWPSGNAQLQTILGHLWPPAPDVNYRRVRLPTDDGLDTIMLDVVSAQDNTDTDTKKVALVIHGLESSSEGVCTLRLVDALSNAGYETWAINHRSCAKNDRVPRTLRLYHAGFIDDVRTVLLYLRTRGSGVPPPRVYLVGFSLGSSILCNFLRFAGEVAESEYGVVGGFGICTPFDPAHCQRVIDYGWRRRIYSGRLAASIVRRFDAALEGGVDAKGVGVGVDVERVRSAVTIGEIDDNFIAPVFGFRDKEDYYESVDARRCLPHISVPTLLLNAANDPFFGHRPGVGLPNEDEFGSGAARLVLDESGGHCGFLDYQGITGSDKCYIGRVAVAFCNHVENELKTYRDSNTSSASSTVTENKTSRTATGG